MEMIKKYFPHLTEHQLDLLTQLGPLYEEWNQKINVISRKDIQYFYTRHVLHSLAIAKVIRFVPGTAILDVGTGGGFPGIPLAILFPDCQFYLVDARKKKIIVVKEIVEALELKNVIFAHERAEDVQQKFDFVVSRAVTDMLTFMGWVRPKFKKNNKNGLPNGVLYLKGGNLTKEMKPFNKESISYFDIKKYFEDIAFFDTKKVVYLQV